MKTLGDPLVGQHLAQCRLVGAVVTPHIDRGFDAASEFAVVDPGVDTTDDAPLKEPGDPGTSCIGAEPHQLAELALRESTVVLQMGENIAVNIIYHSKKHCISTFRR